MTESSSHLFSGFHQWPSIHMGNRNSCWESAELMTKPKRANSCAQLKQLALITQHPLAHGAALGDTPALSFDTVPGNLLVLTADTARGLPPHCLISALQLVLTVCLLLLASTLTLQEKPTISSWHDSALTISATSSSPPAPSEDSGYRPCDYSRPQTIPFCRCSYQVTTLGNDLFLR